MALEYVRETYQLKLKPLLMRAVLYYGDSKTRSSPDHGREFTCSWREAYERICRLANALRKLE